MLVPNHVTEFANSGGITPCLTSFPAVLVAWRRDRDILVQRLEFVYSHVTHIAKVGVVAQNRPPCVSGAIFAAYIAILSLETEASRFLGKYQSYANETAIYVVSGVCLFRITMTEFANSGVVSSCLTSFPAVLVAWQRDRDILVQRLEFVYSHVTHVTKVGVVAQNRPPCVSGVIFAAWQF